MISLIDFTTHLDQQSTLLTEAQQTRCAQEAIIILRSSQRETPRAVYKGRPAYILKEWIRRNPLIDKATLAFLKTELVAYRLGITSANLNASEGLKKFAEEKAYLYNYLAFYRHELQADSDQSPVRIFMNNRYVDWAIAKDVVIDRPDAMGQWPMKYGDSGLQNEDLCVWTNPETRAFIHKPHPCAKIGRTPTYLFSYCVYSTSKGPRAGGDHSWFRLTAPDGKIYEFGKYRPPGRFIKRQALRRQVAMIQSPDCSSMWPAAPNPKNDNGQPPLKHTDGTHRTKIHFEITEASFNRAMNKIIQLKNQPNLSFGLFDESCVILAHQVAEDCGIRIDTRTSVYKLLLPVRLIRLVDRISKYVPTIIGKILYFIPGVFMNIFACACFGARIGSKGDRYIDTIWDLLNPNKSLTNHPWYLATRIKDEVEASRPTGNPFGVPVQFRI